VGILFETREHEPSLLGNATEFTVSELSVALKHVVEDAFGYVRLRGEISGYRGPHGSGHAYFSLKDDKARIEAVIWRGSLSKLRFKPEEGMEVVARGKLTTYPGSSKYQIVIEALEPAGAGALMALLEERRTRLAAEGLFDAARKKPLPFMPRVIGVVTSPTGAVIRDILHRLASRFPLHVVVWPVRVQGESCGAEVADAIKGFNALAANSNDGGGFVSLPDVLIVARGGGSLEDLWGFNDEAVVRAVASSSLPVISAIGHETDWTLIDHAADARAPTPTAAAEMAVPVRADLVAVLTSLQARLSGAAHRCLIERHNRLRTSSRLLPSPDQLFSLVRRRLDEATGRLMRALFYHIEKKQHGFDAQAKRLSPLPLQRTIAQNRDRIFERTHRLNHATSRILEQKGGLFQQSSRVLASVNYKNILARGFVLALNEKQQPIKSASCLGMGDGLTLRFVDGDVAAVVGHMADAKAKQALRAPLSGGKNNSRQGKLF